MKSSGVRAAGILLVLTATASADGVRTRERTVTALATGVYAIRHPDAPSGFPNGNTTVIIGDRGALVVDSTCLPRNAYYEEKLR
jgi:hypothetical protein